MIKGIISLKLIVGVALNFELKSKRTLIRKVSGVIPLSPPERYLGCLQSTQINLVEDPS